MDTDILQFLNELRQEMAEKGLTQEILDDILNDDQNLLPGINNEGYR